MLAILQNTLTLSEALALHSEALFREEHSRYEEDANQQTQIDTNVAANMRNSLNIQQKAAERRKLIARLLEMKQDTERQIQTLRNEIWLLYEIPLPGLYEQLSGLQAQANQNAEAGIINTLNLSQEAEHRRELSEALSEEVSQRIEADTYHQGQIDALICAILENSVNLHSEVACRVEAINQERGSRFAVMRNMLNLNDVLSHQRETLSRETQRRSEQDAGILKQVDSLAEANMWRLVNEHDSRLAISEAMQQIKELPSRSATDDEFNEMLDSLYNQ